MSNDEMDWKGTRLGIGLGFPSASSQANDMDNDASDLDGFERPSFARKGPKTMSFAPPTSLANDIDPQASFNDADSEQDIPAMRGSASPSRKRRFEEDRSAGAGFGTYKSAFSSTAPAKKPAKKNGAGFGGANSFAARMMAKMGYKEGEGLGKDGLGRLAPIDAALRPQGAGLGAVREKTKQAREEEKRVAAINGETLEEDSEEEERRLKKERRKRRQEQGVAGAGLEQSGRQGRKVRYRTVEEITLESGGLAVPDALKDLVNLSGQSTTFDPTSGKGIMVSQETEAAKIARRARRDLEAFAEEWRIAKEMKLQLEMESEQLIVTLDEEEEHKKHAKAIMDALTDLNKLSLSDEADQFQVTQENWDKLTDRLEEVENDFWNDSKITDIQEVAVAAVSSLFRMSMLEWSPLEDPKYLVENISRLQKILGADPARHAPTATAVTRRDDSLHPFRISKRATTLYETMIHNFWLPKVRSAITGDWDVYDAENAVTLLHAWRPILPEFVLNHIVRQLIIPKLIAAISNWKPSRKSEQRSPPHHWLFPWLEFLPQSHLKPDGKDGVAVALRRRVRAILSSHSVRDGVPAWLLSLRSLIFPQHTLRQVATTALLPRLSSYLKEHFIIDPANQDVEPLEIVLTYRQLFSPRSFAELLVARFFPQFFKLLHAWLTSAEPDYGEIEQWFQWWQQEVMPEDVRDQPVIKAHFDGALRMVGEALELDQDAASQLPPVDVFMPQPEESEDRPAGDRRRDDKRSGGRSRRHRVGDRDRDRPRDHRNGRDQRAQRPPSPRTETGARLVPEEITFRSLLEEFCSEQGLLVTSMREAHPVHGAPLLRITADFRGRGGVVGYTQGDNLYVRRKRAGGDGGGAAEYEWKLTGLDEKLVKAAGG